jgi:nucleoside-diphosphate-sugar epimerase
MRTVLVTGGGGFLGRHVVQLLVARGDRVRAFSRGHYPELEAMGVETLRGDIRDGAAVRRACRGVEVVYHAAAVAGIWGRWHRYYQVNTLGTEHVIAGCIQERVPRLVYTSSPSVTFDGSDQCGVDESVPYATRWLCHYPHSKALAEERVLAANGREDLRTCALRPHLIWGPGDPHLVPRLIERARVGQLRRVGEGRNLIDVIYVENAALAHLQAADRLEPGSPVCGRAYFLGQDQPVNCWEWINELLALAGLPPVRRSISLTAAWRLGWILETVHRLLPSDVEPRMTRFLAAQLGRSHYFDTRRARADLGYVPRISTEEGMQRLANSGLNG